MFHQFNKMDCVICFQKVENITYRQYECKHLFHSECLESWKGNCPTCRASQYTVDIAGFKFPLSTEKISFYGKRIVKKLPEDIHRLKNLTHLNLACNCLESLPESIGELSNLRFLDVSHNRLITLPETLINLRKLTYFDSSHNRF